MQTGFSLAQLADSDTKEADKILRACVHCGFCNATCPTYLELGDELDGPRGRIYLIKDMLEHDRAPSEKLVKHIDRCLSCYACMTTCPSGVNYGHLVDQARHRIEEQYRRPFADRVIRNLLAAVLPRPALFRLALTGAAIARPLRGLLPARLKAMLALAPVLPPPPSPLTRAHVYPATGPRKHRVALLRVCAQDVLAPRIDEATIRLLTRHGCEVAIVDGQACCGSLTHHMGRDARAMMRAAIDAFYPRDRCARPRCHRHQCLGLRRDGEGIRLHLPRRAGLCGQGRAGLGAGARSVGIRRRDRLAGAGAKARTSGSPITLRAHCNTARGSSRSPRRCSRKRGFLSSRFPRGISAAARPAPTTCCSRNCRLRCARASS